MGQIVAAIEGMAEACRALDFPVVSGNVSLYNETSGGGIPPTPTVGAVGLLPDYAARASYGGAQEGDVLVLLGTTEGELGASLYLREVLGWEHGAPPEVHLEEERRNGDLVRELIANALFTAVHDLSDGGLVVAAAEMALASDVGVRLGNPGDGAWDLGFIFGEDQGRYLLALKPDALGEFGRRADRVRADWLPVGEVRGSDFVVHGPDDRMLASIPLARLREAHEAWLPRYMGEPG
jgi:phosphoribosylformylglycinamidine synthase